MYLLWPVLSLIVKDVGWNSQKLVNQVDEIYIIKYAIADRSDKLPLHLKIWDLHD
jgi:hypothetical protein